MSKTRRERVIGATIERFSAYKDWAGVTRIADVTGLDRIGIPVHAAYRPCSASISVSMGKGRDRKLSFASALMESLEIHIAELPCLDRINTNVNEMLVSGAKICKDGYIGEDTKLICNTKLNWVSAVDLISDDVWMIAEDRIHTRYTVSESPSLWQSSTNGLSSGNTITEAINHAIMEIVERDALSVFAKKISTFGMPNSISLNTIDCSRCQDILDLFSSQSILVRVFDITNDIDIAVFLAVAIDTSSMVAQPIRWTMGSGCHLSRDIALERALTEVAQVRITLILASRDDIPRKCYTNPDSPGLIHEAVVLSRPVSDFKACPSIEEETDSEVFDRLIEKLLPSLSKRESDEPAVLFKMLHNPFHIPCVKVIIPYLEKPHDEIGYSPRENCLERSKH